eukprot:scpid109866/ scgid17805/ 
MKKVLSSACIHRRSVEACNAPTREVAISCVEFCSKFLAAKAVFGGILWRKKCTSQYCPQLKRHSKERGKWRDDPVSLILVIFTQFILGCIARLTLPEHFELKKRRD